MGWIAINILLPAVAPLIMMTFYLPFRSRLPEQSKKLVRYITALKDGQLCWAGIAYCAAGLYEMHEARGRPAAHGLGSYDGVVETGFILLLVANGAIAAGGAVFPVEPPCPPWQEPWKYYAALSWSMGLASVAGLVFALVHFIIA